MKSVVILTNILSTFKIQEGRKMTSAHEMWLRDNGFALEGKIDPNAIPIALEDEYNSVDFLPGYGCVGGVQRAKFIAEAPAGLWLGGGAVVLKVRVKVGIEAFRDGFVSIPDRRHGGNAGPTAQGWAKYAEGPDLSITARRELFEEIDVYTLGGEGDDLYQPCTEIIPAGFKPKRRVDSLNLALTNHLVYGTIQPFSRCRNHKDRAYIYVGLWDLSDVPAAHRLRVVWEDDFPHGLRPGTNPRVIGCANGEEMGSFEGAQGFISRNASFHPVMRDVFQLIDLPR